MVNANKAEVEHMTTLHLPDLTRRCLVTPFSHTATATATATAYLG